MSIKHIKNSSVGAQPISLKSFRGLGHFPNKIARVYKHEHCVCQKQHGMRYTHLRGLARVTSQLTLLFASMNLKKLAT